MLMLIVGLVLFLGVHSVNMLAPGFRAGMVARTGVWGWKGLVAVLSLIGFVLIVIGYGEARQQAVWLWVSPVWTRHLASLLMLPAMVLLLATYVPGNRLQARIGHPMLLATKIWALAHLFANGALHDLLLFGSFLAWAVVGFIVHRRRDRVAGVARIAAPGLSRDLVVVIGGVLLWAAFSFHLHRLLMGIGPFG